MAEKKDILILVDCQNDFITGSLRNEEAIKVVPNIVEKINNFNGTAIYATMDTHSFNYLKTKEGKNLPIEHCIAETPGWCIEKTILDALRNAESRGIIVRFIYKGTFGTYDIVSTIESDRNYFYEKEEVDESQEYYVGTYRMGTYGHIVSQLIPDTIYNIELCGYCTDVCLVTNALILKTNFYQTADISVDASCCAGVTPEKHKAALEVMKSCQINVINE